MKKIILFISFIASAFLSTNAQGLSLSLDIAAGGLKDAMTEEEMKSVTSLTLTGSMGDADFYLIRDKMLNLQTLDMKSVSVDTIPVKALYKDYFYGNFSQITLPRSLKYIGDSAFVRVHVGPVKIVFTGNFPEIGRYIFNEEDYYEESELGAYIFEVSKDNEYCMKYNNGIYSSDGKTFFLGYLAEPKEGTERIAPRAFFAGFSPKIVIPESVNYIGDEAFANMCMLPFLTKQTNKEFYIVCTSTTPPKLGKKVFSGDEYRYPTYDIYNLYVKEEAIDLYKSTSQWNDFTIKGLNEIPEGGGDNIKTEKGSSLIINNDSGLLEVSDSQAINKVELINITGEIIQSEQPINNKITFNTQQINSSTVILRVIYLDGKIETIKMNLK